MPQIIAKKISMQPVVAKINHLQVDYDVNLACKRRSCDFTFEKYIKYIFLAYRLRKILCPCFRFFTSTNTKLSVAFYGANEANQIMSKKDFIENTTNGDATHLKITQTF